MTIHLRPEDEQLLQKQLDRGVFTSVDDVIHRALETLNADEDWLQQNREEISAKIETGLAQLEQGQGLTPEAAMARLKTKQAEWRSEYRRG